MADVENPTDELGEGGKKALEAERAARRDAERRERELRARVTELELSEARREVAAAKGLSPAQAKRLVGTTREELEADADELLETFGGNGDTKTKPPPPGRAREDLRGGNDPTV